MIREASLGLRVRRNRLHEELEKTLSGRGNKKTKACSVQEDSKYEEVAHTGSESTLSDLEACARCQPAFALQISLAMKGGPPCSWCVSRVDGQVYFS